MTRQSTKQRGVSLIEVMLTLAISALLITTVLAGRNSVRSQAQFNDGMERLKETVLSIKSQANTSNSSNSGAKGTAHINGGSSSYLNLGQTIRFTANSSTAKTNTLLCYANDDLLCGGQLNIDSSKNQSLPWGIKYKSYTAEGVSGGDVTLIFARQDNSGDFTGYWYAGTIANRNQAASVLVKTSEITLNFESPDGRKGTITVNPATGAVTRRVL